MRPPVLIALGMFLSASTVAPAALRNVVLYVTDDQGQDASCYGNPVLKTPTSMRSPPTPRDSNTPIAPPPAAARAAR